MAAAALARATCSAAEFERLLHMLRPSASLVVQTGSSLKANKLRVGVQCLRQLLCALLAAAGRPHRPGRRPSPALHGACASASCVRFPSLNRSSIPSWPQPLGWWQTRRPGRTQRSGARLRTWRCCCRWAWGRGKSSGVAEPPGVAATAAEGVIAATFGQRCSCCGGKKGTKPFGAPRTFLLHHRSPVWVQGAIAGRDKVGLKCNIAMDKLAEVSAGARKIYMYIYTDEALARLPSVLRPLCLCTLWSPILQPALFYASPPAAAHRQPAFGAEPHGVAADGG